jgi:hypothetical protein
MTRRTATTAAIILSLAAAGPPAASAIPADITLPPSHQSPATVYSRPDKPMLPTSATAGGDFLAPAAPATAAVQSRPD